MDRASRSFGHVFIGFILGYYAYANFMMGQFLLSNVGMVAAMLLILFSLIFPILLLIFAKRLEKVRTTIKLSHPKLIKIILTFYILMSLIFLLFYNLSFITTYYYDDWNFILLSFLIIAPAIFASKKIFHSSFRMTPIFFGIFIVLNIIFFYFSNNINWFIIRDLTLPKQTTDIIQISMVLFTLLFEPVLFFFICDIPSSSITRPKILLGSLLIMLVGVYTNTRMISEFGNVIEVIQYPYFLTWRNIQFNEYLQNIDYITIAYWLIGAHMRLMYSQVLITHVWKSKKPILCNVIVVLAAIIALVLLNKVILFHQIKLISLIIATAVLLILVIYVLFQLLKTRRVNNG